MKPESLHALIIDRYLGELSPEAAELLEHHLANHADARAETNRIMEALQTTQETVMRHPELARVPAITPIAPKILKRSAKMPWLARAAALALLACAGGFFAGRSNSPTSVLSGEISVEPRRESPWAKYRMDFNPAGDGMQVVRVDTEKHKTLP